MSRRVKKKKNKAGRMSIGCMVVLLLIVMSIQMIKLKDKNEEYTKRLETLTVQLEEETERANEISDYEEYTKTSEYVEDIAKSKLGLVYDNEIVFKEK